MSLRIFIHPVATDDAQSGRQSPRAIPGVVLEAAPPGLLRAPARGEHERQQGAAQAYQHDPEDWGNCSVIGGRN